MPVTWETAWYDHVPCNLPFLWPFW